MKPPTKFQIMRANRAKVPREPSPEEILEQMRATEFERSMTERFHRAMPYHRHDWRQD